MSLTQAQLKTSSKGNAQTTNMSGKTTYLGSSKEATYVARLAKTWGGNQYWSENGTQGAGWYVDTKANKILPPPNNKISKDSAELPEEKGTMLSGDITASDEIIGQAEDGAFIKANGQSVYGPYDENAIASSSLGAQSAHEDKASNWQVSDPQKPLDSNNLIEFDYLENMQEQEQASIDFAERQEQQHKAMEEKEQASIDENARTLHVLRKGRTFAQQFDEAQWVEEIVNALKQTEEPEEKVTRLFLIAQINQEKEYQEELQKEAEVEKELPSFSVSIIPVVGNAKSSYVHFSHGNYVRGIFYGGMAISDVFLVKSLIQGGAKLTLKLAGKAATGEMGEVSGAIFVRGAGQITKPATEAETKLFLESLEKGVEKSQSQFTSGKIITLEGGQDSVELFTGPNVKWTMHTHPQSRVAMFSLKDVKTMVKGGYKKTTNHSVLGLKWPSANRVLVSKGQEAILDVVKTTINQEQVNLGRKIWEPGKIIFE